MYTITFLGEGAIFNYFLKRNISVEKQTLLCSNCCEIFRNNCSQFLSNNTKITQTSLTCKHSFCQTVLDLTIIQYQTAWRVVFDKSSLDRISAVSTSEAVLEIRTLCCGTESGRGKARRTSGRLDQIHLTFGGETGRLCDRKIRVQAVSYLFSRANRNL